MVLTILGVLDNGTKPIDAYHSAPRCPIRFCRGEAGTIQVSIEYPDGTPWYSAGTEQLIMTVKNRVDGGQMIKKQVSALQKNPAIYLVSFAQSDTIAMDPGLYIYDCWISSSSPTIINAPVVRPSALYLLDSVTP